jgi:hypothetical protein
MEYWEIIADNLSKAGWTAIAPGVQAWLIP